MTTRSPNKLIRNDFNPTIVIKNRRQSSQSIKSLSLSELALLLEGVRIWEITFKALKKISFYYFPKNVTSNFCPKWCLEAIQLL